MLWDLFALFFKIGLVSFGGGFAVIPTIQYEVAGREWLSNEAFREAVSLAGIAPGPIAVNSATLIGYRLAGLPGAVVSTLGMILPSLLIVVAVAACFYKIHHNRWVKAAFYGLRPVVTGLIAFAAIHFGLLSGDLLAISWHTVGTLLIAAAAVYALLKMKWHPIAVIVCSGFAGIVLF